MVAHHTSMSTLSHKLHHFSTAASTIDKVTYKYKFCITGEFFDKSNERIVFTMDITDDLGLYIVHLQNLY